jgi:hypothetical protein
VTSKEGQLAEYWRFFHTAPDKRKRGEKGERERERERKGRKGEGGNIKKSDKITFIHPAAAGEHYGQQNNQIPYHQCGVPS